MFFACGRAGILPALAQILLHKSPVPTALFPQIARCGALFRAISGDREIAPCVPALRRYLFGMANITQTTTFTEFVLHAQRQALETLLELLNNATTVTDRLRAATAILRIKSMPATAKAESSTLSPSSDPSIKHAGMPGNPVPAHSPSTLINPPADAGIAPTPAPTSAPPRPSPMPQRPARSLFMALARSHSMPPLTTTTTAQRATAPP